ncbi:hypothetical protein ANO11243_063620 [Dothideomycetidae sp. 11243]|nr:hypothetical protein ANO11243_063620 [fungal sp. No.11243]
MATPPPRRRLLGTSLKMYFDLPTTQSYITSLIPLSDPAQKAGIDLFVIPSFPSLIPSATLLSSTPIRLGAQDCSPFPSGAYTGDVSPLVLHQAGASLVVLGHAERRQHHGETSTLVAAKAAAAVAHGLVPLICVGETQAPSHIASAAVGSAVAECKAQLAPVLQSLPDDAEIVVAYEPVWAIGAERPAGADHVVAVTRELRRLTGARTGLVRILYGGSAGPGTFEAIKEGVDGLFLGRFAHDIKNLEQVIREMSE